MQQQNMQTCTCTVCGISAHSIKGTRHRRCGGRAGAPLRRKPAPTHVPTDGNGRAVGKPVGLGPHENQGVWE